MDFYWGFDKQSLAHYLGSNNGNMDYFNLSLEDNKLTNTQRQSIPVNEMIYAFGRQLHFTAPINNFTIEYFIKLLTKVIHENAPKYGVKLSEHEKIEITYIVDSPGGSVSAVLKFVDHLNIIRQNHPYFKFISVITGLTASAGTIMSIVADEKKMTPYATAMIHELSSGMGGKFTHMMSYADHLKETHDKLIEIYRDYTDLENDNLEELLNKETWLSAESYKKIGFVDFVYPKYVRKSKKPKCLQTDV